MRFYAVSQYGTPTGLEISQTGSRCPKLNVPRSEYIFNGDQFSRSGWNRHNIYIFITEPLIFIGRSINLMVILL